MTVGTQMGDRLYKYYLSKDWLFHASGSSSKLTNKITTETNRLTGGIIMHLMYLNSKIILAFLSLYQFYYTIQLLQFLD